MDFPHRNISKIIDNGLVVLYGDHQPDTVRRTTMGSENTTDWYLHADPEY